MKIPDIYSYLMETRRQVWAALEQLPDELLSRSLAGDEWFPCLKDLVFHMITVEDGWLNIDIFQRDPVLEQFPSLRDVKKGGICSVSLETIQKYGQAVEKKTLETLTGLTEDELGAVVRPEDWRGLPFTVDGLLWHVMIHEIRHSAQIVLLLRQQGIKPPALDLLFHLADREIKKRGGSGL